MFRILKFERLEARQMLSSTAWQGASGDWDDPSHWNNGVPTPTSVVTIAVSGATVTIPPGETDTVNSLTLGSNAALSMSAVNVTLPATNDLGNSDFESPVATTSTTPPATWWNWNSAYLSRQYAYTGSQSLVVSGVGPDDSSGVIEQSTPATPGDSYTASVYAMTPATLSSSAAGYLELLFLNSSGTEINTATDSTEILTSASATGGPLAGSVGNQGWNHFYMTAVAPSGTASMQTIVQIWAGASTDSIYFDDLELGPAPTGANGPSQLVAGSISNSGAIMVGPSNTVTVSGTLTQYSTGTLDLELGTGGPSQLVAGSISNGGTLTVGPTNTATTSGTFTQTSTGTLDVQLGGPPSPSTQNFGLVNVSGQATLAGTLKADIVNGYSPSTTDTFTPIEFTNHSGSFAGETLPSGAGYQFNAAVSFTNVMISAAPTTPLTATVNASTSLHAVTTNLLGINSAYWDSDAVTTQTQEMVTAAALDIYRFPGGSASDDFHFNDATNWSDTSATTIPQFAQFISSVGGTGVVTVDYGSGSPQEAAAELAYLEGSPEDTASIGNGIEWNDTTGAWQSVNWYTVGYWASLRAAAPDGVNFLKIGHPVPFTDITSWEIGNEEYGSWEVDHHGTAGPGGVGTGAQHDPATYAAFAAKFAWLVSELGLPQISIGIDSGDPTGASDDNWTKNVLTDGLADGIADGLAGGFVPGFISDHSYMQSPGDESDSFLLEDTVSDSGSVLDWTTRYADYQTVLTSTLGSQASSVQVMATEYNSVYTDPGKQSTSLVNGLFVAESLGSLLQSGYSGGFVWDLRNDYDTSQNNSKGLYGWREGGDYGQLGTPNENSPPTTGPYVAYPGYYALQLASEIICSGGQVVSATSNYSDLDVYAVRESSGDLALLVINVNPAASLTEQFDVTGFQPAGAAQVWQYGEAQDTAQSLSTSGASALSDSSTTLSLSGANFSYAFPAYSMTVLDLAQRPTSIAVALASNNLATTGTEQFSAVALAQSGNPLGSQPAFTWSVMGGGRIGAGGNYMPPYMSGSATVSATSGGVTGSATVTYPGLAQWSSATASSWTSSNWTGSTSGAVISPPGLRGVAGDTALFASAGTTVSLNGADPSLVGMTFNSATSYTIAAGSGGAIQLNNGESDATLTVAGGSDTISAPLVLGSNVTVLPAASSKLIISGGVSGAGKSLTVDGPGTVVLRGANSYTGGTTVSVGTLFLADSSAIAANTSLTVGAGGTVVFDSSAAGSTADEEAPANATEVSPLAVPLATKDLQDCNDRKDNVIQGASLTSLQSIWSYYDKFHSQGPPLP